MIPPFFLIAPLAWLDWVFGVPAPAISPAGPSDAQQLAAFIDSRPRPSYPFKEQDYLTEPLPRDSVYYARR